MDEKIIRDFSRRLHNLTLKANEESGGYHKSYEGDLEVSLRINGPFDPKEEWNVHVASYLLADKGRCVDFFGKTLEEALTMLDSWLTEREVELGLAESLVLKQVEKGEK